VAIRVVLFAALAFACASAAPPAPGKGRAWGFLRLVPREGVTPGAGGAGAYGDRRLREVEFVDYARPGFAVVYLEEGPSPGGTALLEIRASKLQVGLDPRHAAVGRGGTLVVRNATAASHVLSCPAAHVLRRIEPGAAAEIPLPQAGEQPVFLLDAAGSPGSAATVFVSPGPFAVTSERGRFELADLDPGRVQLHAWHPRFPPSSRWLTVAPDATTRIDLELGVDRMEEVGGADRP
jgi:hypothetical protein